MSSDGRLHVLVFVFPHTIDAFQLIWTSDLGEIQNATHNVRMCLKNMQEQSNHSINGRIMESDVTGYEDRYYRIHNQYAVLMRIKRSIVVN